MNIRQTADVTDSKRTRSSREAVAAARGDSIERASRSPAAYRHSTARDWTIELSLQALLVLSLLVITLRLWRADLRVPFNYWGDTVAQLAVAKNIADGGWIWFIDRLGAPFGLAMVAFPQNLTTTSLVLKLLSFLSNEPGLILNVYWLLTVVAASVNAHLALRVMGYRAASATALSTLYALLPYAFYRNIAHLPVVYPFIPVLAAFAVQVGGNTSGALTTRWGRYVLVCAVAQAFDYVYNTFFCVFVLVVAASLGSFYHRSSRQATRALVVVAVLLVSTGVNLAPSFIEWSRHGKPPNTGFKVPAEAEVYGLKLRQLLSPVQPSRLASVRAFGVAEQQFPNENENTSTRLGTLLSIGLLAMIVHCFFARALTAQVRAAAALALASFLLSTVGGLGALFNILVAPDIRAYNRIIVYIAFFLVVYLADLLDRWMPARGTTGVKDGINVRGAAASLALVIAVIAGVVDQGQAARPLVDRYASDAAVFWAERAFVAGIERRHPKGGAVMQLPETIFPPDPGHVRMLPYDHARPYLASSRLSWSWPSFSYRREAWYDALGEPGSADFLKRLLASGFVGVWVDRWGYTPAELPIVEDALARSLGRPAVGGAEGRYAYFDLSLIGADARFRISEGERYKVLHPLQMSYVGGFYSEEREGLRWRRWSDRASVFRIHNDDERSRAVVFTALVQAGNAGSLDIAVDGRPMPIVSFAASQSKPLAIPLTIPARSSVNVSFSFKGPALQAPGDSRGLYFALINPRLDDQ